MNRLSDIGSEIDNSHPFDVRVLRAKDYENMSHLSILSEAKKEGIAIL